MTHEFEVIHQFFKPLSHSKQLCASLDMGIGDDGAVLSCRPDSQLVVVTDTLIEGIHFPYGTDAYDIAWKALAVNLSDLAAMGAAPGFFSLALTLPKSLLSAKNSQAWLKSFSQGLADLAELYDMALVGGDTTHAAHLSITITAQGWVEIGQAITRGHAQPAEDIYVSGLIGEGGLGLKIVQAQTDVVADCNEHPAVIKLNRPHPRVALGLALQGVASSAIDVSDGLLADLSHILEASEVGAVIETTAIPVSAAMQQYLQKTEDWMFPFRCGDDYELCFTAPSDKANQIAQLAESLGLSLTQIGKIHAEAGKLTLLKSGHEIKVQSTLGFEHF